MDYMLLQGGGKVGRGEMIVTPDGPKWTARSYVKVRGCFSFGGTVQYIEESNIYLCFVVCRLKRGLVT